MGSMKEIIFTCGLLALASRALAQVATVSPPNTEVTFKLNIPANTASSGSGDIFFQISAPSTYEWVALGQGSGMVNANIFVVYTSADGNNVTLSPRLATRYAPPSYSDVANVTLLEGSGVSNGKMVANVKCSSCDKWPGGSTSFTESSGAWIYAYSSSGGPKNSNDVKASITQHDNQDPFTWPYANAKGGSSVNPLISSASATTSCVPRPTSNTVAASAAASGSTTGASAAASGSTTGASTTTQTSDDDDDDRRSRRGRPTTFPANDKRQEINYCDSESSNTDVGFAPISATPQSNIKKRLAAHGIIASLAFVILFPAGAIAIRLGSFAFVVALHSAFQVFAFLVYIAAFGLGITMARDLEVLDSHHPIIGIVVFILLFLQPLLGIAHHTMFKKHQTRTMVSHAHIWVGRIAIALGIINGGLGFKLADSMSMGSKSGKIAYAVLAAIFGLAWLGAILVGERTRAKRVNAPPKYTDTPLVERTESNANGHYAPK